MGTWNSSIIRLQIANSSHISPSQKLTKKRRLNQADASFVMYGIVTTAYNWLFLRWTGSLGAPLIMISKNYNTGDFVGEMEGSKSILCYIIRVLMSAIKAVDNAEPAEAAGSGFGDEG